MGKLITHILIIILLYRYYKRYYGEWGGWHLTFFNWIIITFLVGGMSASAFWDYNIKSFVDFFYYLYISSIYIIILYCIFNTFVWLQLSATLTEIWWSYLCKYGKQLYEFAIYCYYTNFYKHSVCNWLSQQLNSISLIILCYCINIFIIFSYILIILLLILGAIGYYDSTSYEGWWYYFYW